MCGCNPRKKKPKKAAGQQKHHSPSSRNKKKVVREIKSQNESQLDTDSYSNQSQSNLNSNSRIFGLKSEATKSAFQKYFRKMIGSTNFTSVSQVNAKPKKVKQNQAQLEQNKPRKKKAIKSKPLPWKKSSQRKQMNSLPATNFESQSECQQASTYASSQQLGSNNQQQSQILPSKPSYIDQNNQQQ